MIFRLSVLLASITFSGMALAECGNTVDLADSLDIRRFHVECDEDQTLAQDQDSDAPVNATGADSSSPLAAKAARVADHQIVVEPFSLTVGPQSALAGLFRQMAERCPNGWEKHREWSEATATGYLLKFEFSCR